MANDRLRDALLRAEVGLDALADKLHVDRKTAERWITQGRTPYPKHRHAISTLVGQTEAYLWPGALSAERAAQVAQSEVVHVYPHRAAVPHDLWIRMLGGFTERLDMEPFPTSGSGGGLEGEDGRDHRGAALGAAAQAA